MSGSPDAVESAGEDSARPDAPEDLLRSTPETAYLWGRVAADGSVADGTVTVRVGNADAADRIAALFGSADTDLTSEVTEREYAHNTDVTRTSDEYVVTAETSAARRAAAAFGLPTAPNESGGYRFSTLDDHRRQLLRGIVEGCGTVCYKSDANAVGISFVHDDEALLATVRDHLDAAPVEVPYGDLNESSSGGYWFGVADEAGPAVGEWLYEGSAESGLFAPQRRRKTRKSIERVREGVAADTDRDGGGEGADSDGGST